MKDAEIAKRLGKIDVEEVENRTLVLAFLYFASKSKHPVRARWIKRNGRLVKQFYLGKPRQKNR